MADRHEVLVVRTGDGSEWIPSFQFGDDGQLLPHLQEAMKRLEVALRRIDIEGADPWFIAEQLNAKTPEWGGRTAAQLLRTEHAGEVLWQLGWERMPLDQRQLAGARMERATGIAERIAELTLDVPIELDLPTLYTTAALPQPRGVVLLEVSGRLLVLSFALEGNPEETARVTAQKLRAHCDEVRTVEDA